MNRNKPKLIAVDGNSLLYRAFFAMRYLSTSAGVPTNAVYGLTTMLLKVLEEKPDYIVVAFDTPKPTFRHIEYDQYKAHRKAAPDALIEQAPVARELIQAFNIPTIEIEGYEGDDIIGALVTQARQHGVASVILTGDLDALQLVNEDVQVLTTVKGVSDIVVYDEQAVEDRFGLKPDQIADMKGLKGDSSDNIPGVPGIGDKTAQSLLSTYGTVEGVLDHMSELPEGKVKKALQENADIARLSKRLATIVTDVPFEFDLESYRSRQPDFDTLRDLFVRLEFKTMLKRLPEVEQAAGKASVEERPALGECRRIDSAQELSVLIESLRKAGAFAMQCNTTLEKSIDAQLLGISFCADQIGSAYVQIEDAAGQTLALSMEETYQADLPDLIDILSAEDITKYVHDAKRNIAALALRGVGLKGIDFDAMLGAYVLDSSRGSYDIGSIAFEQLSIELAGVTSKNAEVDDVEQFCSEAEVIYRVKPLIEERLRSDAEYSLYHDIELPLAGVLAGMELTGVTIDRAELEALSFRLNSEIRELEQQIYQSAGEQFNIGSPKQIGTVLFEKMGLTGGKRTKTGYSTSAATLEALAGDHPVVEQILKWRELTKLKSTYADALPKLINPFTNRVHTSLNQAVTATGRLSSSDPNLQNIPVRTELGREIRRAFVAEPGCVLLSADYSQIELRIMAHVTGDAGLVSAFEHDLDIHTRTASTIFGCSEDEVTPEMRRRAKTVNFAVIYGMSDFALSRTLDIPFEEARTYIDTYFARFPGVREYTNSTIEQARERGYVSTQLGRRRYVPDIHNANRNVRQFAERAAVNMPIQGMAADIIKIAMLRIADTLTPYTAKMVLQVHDELLFELPTGELDAVAELVRQAMENAHPLKVPLKVDVKAGPNWAEMENVPRRT